MIGLTKSASTHGPSAVGVVQRVHWAKGEFVVGCAYACGRPVPDVAVDPEVPYTTEQIQDVERPLLRLLVGPARHRHPHASVRSHRISRPREPSQDLVLAHQFGLLVLRAERLGQEALEGEAAPPDFPHVLKLAEAAGGDTRDQDVRFFRSIGEPVLPFADRPKYA
jgi:hypothetical protein